MKEKLRLTTVYAKTLRVGSLIYARGIDAPDIDFDWVYHVLCVRHSGNVIFLRCAGRGPDSDIYANNPSAFHFALPENSLVNVVKS